MFETFGLNNFIYWSSLQTQTQKYGERERERERERRRKKKPTDDPSPLIHDFTPVEMGSFFFFFTSPKITIHWNCIGTRREGERERSPV